jgi:signal transduction histidine kinase
MAEIKAKILYIEDDPSSQILVRRMLIYAGYQVVVASRGIEGIDVAKNELPDLILMDINLPDMSGREVATRLRSDSRFDSTPIVALTSQSHQGEKELALVAGVTGFLSKPADIDRLPSQIAFYLRGGRDTADETSLKSAAVAYSHEVVGRLESKIRELERSNAELQRLDRVKDDFIQLTAHELRTPLTLISGYSRLLQDSQTVHLLRSEDPEISMFIDGLVDSIDRMTRVINEILVVSRIATDRIDLSLIPLNLGELVESVLLEFEPSFAKRNLAIQFDGSNWPTVSADRELIALAVQNLVSNAIKYTPDGGVISITCRVDKYGVQISFADSGIGIDAADQEHIFNRFVTTSDTHLHSTSKTNFKGGGLGIGLAICRGIVLAHGGKMWVESPGRDEQKFPGSTFYVYLPKEAHATESVLRKAALR